MITKKRHSGRTLKRVDIKHLPGVAPSILSADFSSMGEEIRAVTSAGADCIHVDVMDAHFVPNLTIGPPVIRSIRKTTTLPFDVHLMMDDPSNYIDAFACAGSDYITVHYEACKKKLPFLAQEIRRRGCVPGISINPDTPFLKVKKYIRYFDMFLVMSVYPGFGGQKFIPSVLGKIRDAAKWKRSNQPGLIISVDGGIDEKTGCLARKAGADLLVAGTAIFGAKNYKRAIKSVRGK